MAGTIYRGTYVNGIVLSNPATQDPATITATGKVSGIVTALFGKAGTAWTVSNFGTIEGTGSAGSGIYLAAGGSITNSPNGFISGSRNGVVVGHAIGGVVNSGTIEGTGTASGGIYLTAGGSVTNNPSGVVSGSINGVTVGHATGAIVNSGTIEGTGGGSGGIYLTAGGSVTNRSGGLITGNIRGITVGHSPGNVENLGTISGDRTSGGGIWLISGGSVSNGASGSTAALIEGPGTAIAIGSTAGGSGTVANFGIIKSTTGDGVFLAAGGTVNNFGTIKAIGTSTTGIFLAGGSVTNGSGRSPNAQITGGDGVVATGVAGTVINYGTIRGPIGSGIELDTGGEIVNGSGASTNALITGGDGVFVAGAAGTIINNGTIDSSGTTHTGIALNSGGRITNGSSASTKALIEGGDGISVGGGSGAVANFGTITATSQGVILNGGGTVANYGTIDSSGAGINLFVGGEVTNGSSVLTSALIEAAEGVVVSGTATGTVTNFGTIKAGADEGVFLEAGGTARNFGTIENSGTANFAVVAAKGAVINGSSASTKALIEGVGGVFLSGTAATGAVTNYGTIKATTEPAVILDGGGTVSNFGTIESARLDAGIRGAGGTIANFGTVISTNTSNGGAVWLAKGGVVTNGSGGSTAALIASERFAVYIGGNLGTHYAGAVGTVTNFATIETTGTPSAVLLVAGGTVRNFGTISGYRAIHFESAAGIVTNYGTIKGATANGVTLDAGGMVTNRGLISGGSYGVALGTTASAGHIVNFRDHYRQTRVCGRCRQHGGDCPDQFGAGRRDRRDGGGVWRRQRCADRRARGGVCRRGPRRQGERQGDRGVARCAQCDRV